MKALIEKTVTFKLLMCQILPQKKQTTSIKICGIPIWRMCSIKDFIARS